MGKDLTTIIRNSQTSFENDQIDAIKDIVKEWLETVDLPEIGSVETTRKLLTILVDEPE